MPDEGDPQRDGKLYRQAGGRIAADNDRYAHLGGLDQHFGRQPAGRDQHFVPKRDSMQEDVAHYHVHRVVTPYVVPEKDNPVRVGKRRIVDAVSAAVRFAQTVQILHPVQ